MSYPANEIRWVIPNTIAGGYYIQIKGYGLPWTSFVTERGYNVIIRWDGSKVTNYGEWESEPNNGGGSYDVFSALGRILRTHSGSQSDIDEYKVTLINRHDIESHPAAKREISLPMQWVDVGGMLGSRLYGITGQILL